MDSGELVGVGAFAQLSGLTVETLRHYHQVGLLVPVEVDVRTGYRRYGLRQLPRARALAALRDVGMPLEDAAAIIHATDRGARRARLAGHRRRLTDEARRAAGRVEAVDRMIERDDRMQSPPRIDEGTPALSGERLARELLGTLDRTDFARLGARHAGKARDSYVDGDVRTIVTTDRLSAFDRLLGTIPFKGQALSQIANYWFDATRDIVPNHLPEAADPNIVRVRQCAPVPLEFVVRGYITGVTKTSLWPGHEAGARNIAGHPMPGGLRRNERLARPDPDPDDQIVLIDEVHTPDSSRYWHAGTYDELFRKNQDQRSLDKEPLRERMAERGFRGDGKAPAITDEVRIATATRYILLAEELTQRSFEPPELTAAERVANVLRD